jgi:hypothetical protein
VDGKAIPDVNFDTGESYAGHLPISANATEENQLFFWFFPTVSEDEAAKKEIVIWLNGGVSKRRPAAVGSANLRSLVALLLRASSRRTGRSCGNMGPISQLPTPGAGIA